MPVVLVAIENEKGEVFLVDRKKRPFWGKLSLPAGRMIQGEGFEEAVERIMKKFGVKAKFERVCSISLEHVKKGEIDDKLHSFLLILVKAKTSSKLEYVDFVLSEEKIISSDYKLIRDDLGKKLEIDVLETLD